MATHHFFGPTKRRPTSPKSAKQISAKSAYLFRLRAKAAPRSTDECRSPLDIFEEDADKEVVFSLRHLLGTLLDMEVEWYERAVQLGSTDALWGLAHRLQRGLGCNRDYDRAMKLYIAAAATGDPYAAEELGEEYLYRDVPDFDLAAKYFEEAAQKGLTMAQTQIGWMYWEGQGVPHRPETAVFWYQKAAAQGSHEAYIKLGIALCDPQFDVYSPIEAFELFTKALTALSKDTIGRAKFNLGLCYLYGEGITTDKNLAAKEFLDAFNMGWQFSCKYLAQLASEGVFAPNDQRTAADWNKLAEEVSGTPGGTALC